MARAVVDVALRGKYVVLAIAGLDPVEVDQLRSKVLREILLHVVVFIDGEHAERSRRAVAASFHLEGQIMKEIQAFAAAVQERADVVREPEPGENILKGFACR